MRRLFLMHREGAAMIEFALAVPILMFLLLGGTEMGRFLIINQKAEKVAFTVADIVGQSTTLSAAQLDQYMIAAAQIMRPYSFGASGRVIITSVAKTGSSPPTVRWRYAGGGTMSATSHIGAVGGNATLPNNLAMADKDNVIVAEVFYRYAPTYGSEYLTGADLYKVAVYKPRLGALTNPPS